MAPMIGAALLALLAGSAEAAKPRPALRRGVESHGALVAANRSATTALANATSGASQAAPTFQTFYDAQTGRGIWKWTPSLMAYQRHFAALATLGTPTNVAEVGVQSGGSIQMWQGVLGPQCHVYGLDINPNCQKFTDAKTTITIMDQGSEPAWDAFFAGLTAAGQQLDVLVDDGSHQAHHMSFTVHRVFPELKPGGHMAVEDIHGRAYVQSFFFPVAQSIHYWNMQNMVHSVHMYPFQLMIHKAGGLPQLEYVPPTPVAVVNDFPQLWPALLTYPGQFIKMENPAWGPFLAEAALKNIFQNFAPLHDYTMADYPVGCHKTADPVCTVQIHNSVMQNQVLGVHVYNTHLLVEVAPTTPTPVIAATRKGDQFIAYG